MAKVDEYRDLAPTEWDSTLEDLFRKLYDLRNEKRTKGRVEQPHEIRAARRNIARLQTVMRESRK